VHDHFYAVILAGGGGTRLWPRSRKAHPKQFLDLAGEETMLQAAYARIAPILSPERVLVITNAEYTGTVQQQLPALPAHNIVGEPAGRGTAPAIGLAAVMLQHRDPAAIMAVLTADHLIARQETFRRVLLATAQIAATAGRLVTLSITPTFAETGYGYVERGAEVDRAHGFVAYRVQRFTEKPNRDTAERFVASGRFGWNSGMFVWRIDSILDEIARQMPTLSNHLATIAAALGIPDETGTLASVWPRIRSETIDFGIMEGARDVVTLPVDIGWNDVGSWAALADELPANEEGNVVHGPHVLIDTHDSFVFSDGRLIATIGLDNMIVVDTADAILICPRSRAQDVKKVTEALQARGLHAYLEGIATHDS
jgi:mannose-1-phosphate guanylyltransferase